MQARSEYAHNNYQCKLCGIILGKIKHLSDINEKAEK